MSKFSKRKRTKEIGKGKDDVEDALNKETREETVGGGIGMDCTTTDHSKEIKSTRAATRSTSHSSGNTLSGADKVNPHNSAASGNTKGQSSSNDERVWVLCNKCDKWRAVPSSVDVDSLPEVWFCALNTYDPSRNTCDAPEEIYKETEADKHKPLKTFLKLWTKKLRNGDRAESRLPPSSLTRGRKRKLDVEWIRCCNPSCGKWRAVLRTLETSTLLTRMSKGKKFGGESPLWYCCMNSWDDSTASCAAPQEPLWDCKWNLNLNAN